MSIALYALAPRAKSRDELFKQLLKRGVDADNANAVLDSLELQGLLNDLEFAKLWSESRQRAKKLSKRVIAGELRTKGVSQDIINEVIEELAKLNVNWNLRLNKKKSEILTSETSRRLEESGAPRWSSTYE